MLIEHADDVDVITIDEMLIILCLEDEQGLELIEVVDHIIIHDHDELDVQLILLENLKHSHDDDEEDEDLHHDQNHEQVDDLDEDETDEMTVNIDELLHSIDDDEVELDIIDDEVLDEVDINDLLLLNIQLLVDI